MRVIFAVCAALWVVSAAAAEPVRSASFELRLGLMQHDFDALNNGAGGKESGLNISVEALLQSPDFLEVLGSPRPYANFSWNDAGDTNFGGVGLAWQTPAWRDRVFGELDLGVVVHDGVVSIPDDLNNPLRRILDTNRVILGSRELFRSVLGVGYRASDDWDVQVTFEHLSHGQILASGRNEGLDNIGLRFSRRFGVEQAPRRRR